MADITLGKRHLFKDKYCKMAQLCHGHQFYIPKQEALPQCHAFFGHAQALPHAHMECVLATHTILYHPQFQYGAATCRDI